MNCTITPDSFRPRRERERTGVFHNNKYYGVLYIRTFLPDGTHTHEIKYSSSIKTSPKKSLTDAVQEFKGLVDKLRL